MTPDLRSPRDVMRLSRLGSFHQTRLSFMRQLTRRMAREGWTFDCPDWSVDGKGVGHAILTAHTGARSYSLVAFAHDLPAEKRSDRVIAEAWDATFTLFDGVPTPEDIARLAQNVPLQEAGRVTARELTLSRANRSGRLWDHVVGALATGAQPDAKMLDDVGYLMRTTAVYGSGKFGAADHAAICERAEFSTPFQAEMLTVYLIRWFVIKLINHMARATGGAQAVALSADRATKLGIGNSTGLGMAPFLINHPVLINNWILARETALARVLAQPVASRGQIDLFTNLLHRARADLGNWTPTDAGYANRVSRLREGAETLCDVAPVALTQPAPWRALLDLAADLSPEAEEWIVGLMLEPHGDLVDTLAATMSDTATPPRLDGTMTVGALRRSIEDLYDWAIRLDWTTPEAMAHCWYVSAEKQEPRLGLRHSEPIEPFEQPLCPGRDIARLHDALTQWDEATPIAEVLMRQPDHRGAVQRVQTVLDASYAEIRDNTIAHDLSPLDLLRCKLSFFGATRFDPRSDRWLRICMFAGAPYPPDLGQADPDFWVYPTTGVP